MKKTNYYIDEPVMSDQTLLVSVEDLINTAFGPMAKNTVNFKLVQTILHILARQLRLLEQDVQIKFDEIGIDIREPQQAGEEDDYDDQPIYTSSSSEGEVEDVRGAERERRRDKGAEKKERAEKRKMKHKREKKERSEKGGREEKGERIETEAWGEKGGRERKSKRGEKGHRGEKGGREGKGERGEKREREKGGQEEKGERGEKGEREKGGQEEKGELGEKEEREKGGQEEKGERGEKGERDEKGGQDGKGERGEKEERGEKGEKKEKTGKGEKEDTGRGKTSAKDREGQAGSKDRDEKDREDRKSRDRETPGKSPRGRKGDERGEERRGGRSREHGGERGADRHGERGSRPDDRKGSVYRSAARQESITSITVTEASRRDGRGKGATDKILVAERGPASRDRPARVGSIEVVTASQFALLERAVRQLEQLSGPPPVPSLPDNEKLRQDLAQGRASLSETMQAVQLNARVLAAEQGLSRMAELLTQLARAGALPLDLASHIGQMQAQINHAASAAGTTRFADAEHGGTDTGYSGADTGHGGVGTGHGGAGTGHGLAGTGRSAADPDRGQGRSTKLLEDQSIMTRMIPTKRSSVGSAGAAGAAESGAPPPGVTHHEMHEVLEYMKEAITKEIQNLTARANHSADIASNTSRNVAAKLDIALQIDARVNTLFSQTADYAEQLSGFDSGLSTQMTSFQEQMTQMKNELRGGLTLLESANNNAETAAVTDLSERYEELVIELDNTVHLHQNLATLHQQLSDELRSLVECVEMLREQKADRDEVLDGLRDKADMSRLAGLLYQKDFAQARYEIEKCIAKCYDKFHEQDQVWQTALNDLSLVTDNKEETIALMALKESATQELNNILEKLRKLEIMLGEPQAALLMRQLAKHAACGACQARAVMPPLDAAHGQPRALPRLRPAPLGADDPCLGEAKLSPPDTREHTCRRWVGGSHTLLGTSASRVLRQKAGEAAPQAAPAKKFGGYGTDGKLYMMEEDLQPCAECNKLSADEPGHAPAHFPRPAALAETRPGDTPLLSNETTIKETIILGRFERTEFV